ncbi:MAG: acyltransferase [Gemmatimonadota bacterium]
MRGAGSDGAAPLQGLPSNLREGLALAHMPALDGIRAVAAFTVVFYHAGIPLVPAGQGVLAFFVLSGFLITWLLLREDEATGTISLKGFYARRSLRIFPPFIVYWCVVLVLLRATGNAVHVPQAIASFLYVNNYYQALTGDPNTLLSHTWSLGVEEQFYLLWPAAFIALRHDRRRLARVLTGMVVALWVYREVMVLGVGIDQGYVYEAFDMRADHLLVGCLMAVTLRAGLWPGLWRFLTAAPARMVVTALLLILSIAAAHVVGGRYRDVVGFILDPVLMAVLIVQAIAFCRSPVAKWLNWGWMRYLGAISYPVYLYHPLTVAVVDKAPLRGVPYLGLVLLLTTLAAAGSYHIVERPMLRLKKRFAASVPRPQAASRAAGTPVAP